MILDHLKHVNSYTGAGGLLGRGLEFLRDTDLKALPDGKHPIDGDRLFATLARYDTKPKAEGKWEAHRKYIDIQALLEGRERVGAVDIGRLKPVQDYDAEKDYILLKGRGDFVTLRPGLFAVFFPWDAHMPAVAIGTPKPVRKIVVKVLVE
ncbi:MAG: YhcH/YjgK/YiaL family protein [Lentisphaerae bacterium]|nr:YhcH/YjgK/YiaL family protein [Lentisphaerota bacterium]